MSRSTHNISNNEQTETSESEDGTSSLVGNAVRLSRTTLKDRIQMRALIVALDQYAELERRAALIAAYDPSAVPFAVRAALRSPVGSRRKTVTVSIDDSPVALLLNPQGKVDPEREQWLWDYVVARVRKGAR